MSERIDVLAELDEAIARCEGCADYCSVNGPNDAMRNLTALQPIRAAVAELIAADREYDAAMARRVTATNAIVSGDRSDDAFRRQAATDHAFDRAVARRAAALAAAQEPGR